MDTNDLAASMAAFARLARAGGFREPEDGWSAQDIVAHVAATNRLVAIVAAEVMVGREATFDSRSVQCRQYLRALREAAGSWDALIDMLEVGAS
jgi:hypothetical protein